MNTIRLRRAATVLLFGAILAGCGAGRTLVMEPPSERRTFAGAAVVNGEDSVIVPAELRGRLTEKVQEGLYGTAEKPGNFRNELGLEIRIRVVQFEQGNQFQRWFWGGLGNQGEGSLHVLAEFYDGDKKLAYIQTEGRIGSGAFGGSLNWRWTRPRARSSSTPARLSTEPAGQEPAVTDARASLIRSTLHFGVELARLAAGRLDRRADHDANRPGFFQEPATRPEVAGVVRDRHDLHAGLRGEQRARHSVLARLAGRHPRAFRKDQDPDAGGEPVASLVEHLVDRAMSGAAIDGDALHQPASPSRRAGSRGSRA